MRLFLYEQLCASGTFSSLRNEGWAMLSALVEDFMRLPGCEVWTLLDQHCPTPLGHHCYRLHGKQTAVCSLRPDPETLNRFRSLANAADATLVIAPETDGVLADLCCIVAGTQRRWLGCEKSAIDLCADKMAWRSCGSEGGAGAANAYSGRVSRVPCRSQAKERRGIAGHFLDRGSAMLARVLACRPRGDAGG